MKSKPNFSMKPMAAFVALTATLWGGTAVAGEAELQAQVQELAKKLEALQKQIAETRAAQQNLQPTTAATAGSTEGRLNLSVFGNVDVGYGRQSNIAAAGAALSGSTSKYFNGGMVPSNVGIAGSLALDNDISAIFRLDTEFLTSTGANLNTFSGQTAPSAYNGTNGNYVLFNRAAFGGIASPYGTVTLGRQQTVAVDAVVKVEPSGWSNLFYSSAYGAFGLGNAIYGQAPVNTAAGKYSAGVSGNLDSRDNAMLKYTSPVFGGARVIAGYSPGAVAGSDSAGSKLALGATYDIGALSIGGSYTKWDPVDAVTSQSAKYKLSNLGAAYNFGRVTVRVAAGHTSLPAVTLKDATNTNVAYSAATANVVGAGATFALTPKINLIGAYYSKKYDIAAGNQPRVDTLGLGATYELYKSTKLYALFDNASSKGDNGANQVLGGHNSARAIAVGLTYGFNADFSR